ncbi:MerR family transcriptional regulator [Roseateles amylovorans]|uniref:MerR family transcriptional regulator n=1 Tax=Roseateles amylovorans TaxID=2978473 RepID=A0ABY6AZT7_9BURK|nr:MerR family transcriptional regulator [Roseateles amylovorans]UXH77406.1 MerR family transcriptional regulator [Roseateles amylovorans]
MPNPPISSSPVSTGSDDDVSLRRSGAVARMLRMPVATLRVWERRYALTPPRWSTGGQRLYSADDVRRLALIKQLTELGHAIGSLAALDMSQLQAVAANHVGALSVATRREHAPSGIESPAPWRLAVIGSALGARMQRPSLLRRLGRTVQVVGPFDSMADAARSLALTDIDALLIHQPHLHAGWLAEQEAAAPRLMGVPMAVLYGFAADAVCESLAAVGITLLREPQPDVVIGHWLRHFGLETGDDGQMTVAMAAPPAPGNPWPARRWDDDTLVAFASRSSTVACECPRHVAELLMQLSHFEGYSAECENRGPADAALHDYLRQVAAESRARFESALERVAQHEGWPLPAPADAKTNANA